MWGSGGFASKGSDQLFLMGLWVSAGCWHTAHEPGNITMRLRGASVGTLWDRVVYSTCGSRRGVRGAVRRCPDAFYFSMTTTLTFWSMLSPSLSPWGFRASPAIVPPCEAFGEVRCSALGKRFPRFCFNYGDVKVSFHLTLSSVLGKRRKLHGAKSGRYRGFGTTSPLLLTRSSRIDRV